MRAVPLGELGEIVSGSTPKTGIREFWDGKIPWITPADLSDHNGIYFHGTPKRISQAGFDSCSTSMLPSGSILFSSRAPIGHSAILAYPACTNQGFKNIVPNNRLDPLYGYFALKFLTPAIVAMGRGATFAEINKEMFQSVQFPYCDLPDQRRIAMRLEQADRLCRTRRCALELTDASLLPAAFLGLFGDPAVNPLGFDRVLVESLFSESRDGAKCGPFGSALKKHEYVAAGIPVWTMNNVGANEFVEEGCLYVTPQKFEELAGYDARNGDILISRAGTVGRMSIVRTGHPRSIIHSNIIRLALNEALVLPTYFVSLMTWFAPRVAKLKRGQEDAYTFMSTSSLAELLIPLPPLPLQRRFVALTERLERLRAVQREAVRQAEHLFDSLLHRAFT